MKLKFFTPKRKCATLLISCMLIISCIDDFNGGPKNQKETREALATILQDFIITEEAKDAAGHSALYLSDAATVNFVLKNNGSPNLAVLTRDQWIGFFTSWDYEYFPVYSEIDFTIKRGMAIDSHLFQGFRDEQPDLFGNDLFMYVKTPEGWKIVSLSSTITAPDDTTDYDALGELEASPIAIFNAFKTSYDTVNTEDFTALFVNGTAPCFKFKKVFEDNFSEDLHSANAFINTVSNEIPDGQIVFRGLKIEIKDQYSALASSSYIIRNASGGIEEKGQMLATMVGTPTNGWKISAMLFSVSYQKK